MKSIVTLEQVKRTVNPLHFLPRPHIRQSQDHPLAPLSAVQSLLNELSLNGKRERKQLSAAFSQLGRNSSPTAAWLTGLYCLISKRSVRTCQLGALRRQTGSVFPPGGGRAVS